MKCNDMPWNDMKCHEVSKYRDHRTFALSYHLVLSFDENLKPEGSPGDTFVSKYWVRGTLPPKTSCLVYPCRFFHGKKQHGGQKKLSTTSLLQPSKNVNSCENNCYLNEAFHRLSIQQRELIPSNPNLAWVRNRPKNLGRRICSPQQKNLGDAGTQWPSANSASISDSNLKLVDMTQFQPQGRLRKSNQRI